MRSLKLLLLDRRNINISHMVVDSSIIDSINDIFIGSIVHIHIRGHRFIINLVHLIIVSILVNLVIVNLYRIGSGLILIEVNLLVSWISSNNICVILNR
jgi:hypothetical protein